MIQTVVIANTAEAFAPLLEKVSRTEDGVRRIRHELTLSQRAFFWEEDNKIVVTPHPIPPSLMRHNALLCGFLNVVNLCPAEEAVELSEAVSRDLVLYNYLIEVARKNGAIKLCSYSATNAFLRLLKGLSRSGVEIIVDEMPEAYSVWISKYLDSKLGFRAEFCSMAKTSNEILIPNGFAARSLSEAKSMVEWFYAKKCSSVLKVNFGESGWGTWIIRPEEYGSVAGVRKAFGSNTSLDPIWKNAILVVEEFIEPDVEVAGGSPSVEFFIADEGVRVTYCCGQLLDAGSQFFGIEMGKGVLSAHIKDALVRIARRVGEHYRLLGYRGFCDIDFVVAKNGELYAVETNTRRTGGTHVHDLAKRLFGDSWERDRYFFSHDSFRYGDRVRCPDDLLLRLRPVLFPRGKDRTGIVITSINPSEPIMGFVAIAADREKGRRLKSEIHAIFSHGAHIAL